MDEPIAVGASRMTQNTASPVGEKYLTTAIPVSGGPGVGSGRVTITLLRYLMCVASI